MKEKNIFIDISKYVADVAEINRNIIITALGDDPGSSELITQLKSMSRTECGQDYIVYLYQVGLKEKRLSEEQSPGKDAA